MLNKEPDVSQLMFDFGITDKQMIAHQEQEIEKLKATIKYWEDRYENMRIWKDSYANKVGEQKNAE
jgi:hypothetical protein